MEFFIGISMLLILFTFMFITIGPFIVTFVLTVWMVGIIVVSYILTFIFKKIFNKNKPV